MAVPIIWTPDMDATIRTMRARGVTFRSIADRIGVELQTAIRRGRQLGLPTGHISRGPIPGVRAVAERCEGAAGRPHRGRSAAEAATDPPTTLPYRVRRDEYGSQAIERAGYTVLILATGAERNAEEVDALVSALNREAMRDV